MSLLTYFSLNSNNRNKKRSTSMIILLPSSICWCAMFFFAVQYVDVLLFIFPHRSDTYKWTDIAVTNCSRIDRNRRPCCPTSPPLPISPAIHTRAALLPIYFPTDRSISRIPCLPFGTAHEYMHKSLQHSTLHNKPWILWRQATLAHPNILHKFRAHSPCTLPAKVFPFPSLPNFLPFFSICHTCAVARTRPSVWRVYSCCCPSCHPSVLQSARPNQITMQF